MKKDFQKWHDKKSEVDRIKERPFLHVREIWFCHLGVNIGFEQDGNGDRDWHIGSRWGTIPCKGDAVIGNVHGAAVVEAGGRRFGGQGAPDRELSRQSGGVESPLSPCRWAHQGA